MVLKTETRDGDDRLLNEQYVTEFYRGHLGRRGRRRGSRPTTGCPRSSPGRSRPPSSPIRSPRTSPQRYAEASGDHNAFHLDDELARAAGLPGIIVHGLCLMAFAGRACSPRRTIEDPAAIRRLAVRFSRPMEPGDALTTRVLAREGGSVRFDAIDGAGEVVLKDGLAEARRVGASVVIDLDAVKAIDVHTHVEVSRDGHDPIPPELREASAEVLPRRRRHADDRRRRHLLPRARDGRRRLHGRLGIAVRPPAGPQRGGAGGRRGVLRRPDPLRERRPVPARRGRAGPQADRRARRPRLQVPPEPAGVLPERPRRLSPV